MVWPLNCTFRSGWIDNHKEKVDMNCSRSSALTLFLTGLGTGIAFSLLLAPRSGSATRGLIVGKVGDAEGWVKDKAAATRDYVETQGAEVRNRIKEVAEVIGRG